jgi:hypothetical protein
LVSIAKQALYPEQQLLFEKFGFSPTPGPDGQMPILLSNKRFVVVSGGEQGGKSRVSAAFLESRYLQDGESDSEALLYWLVGRKYEHTTKEFQYLLEDFTRVGAVKDKSKRVDPGFIELHDGTIIRTKSADDPRNLMMEAPHGIIACEGSNLDLETFERIMGRVAPKRGWVLFAGTLELGGSVGWFPQILINWRDGKDTASFELPSWTNTHLYPGGRNDTEILRLERDSSDQFFMERIAGKPVPPRGLVFPEIRPDIHVKPVEYVEGHPVHLWIDPGYAGAYAVEAIQIFHDQVWVIDEVYEQGLVLSEILDIVRHKPWIGDVSFGVIDIAGTQHQGMPSHAEIWLQPPPEGIGLYLESNKISINEGTERLRGFLKPHPLTNQPKIIINSQCKGLLSEFGLEPNPFDGQVRAYRWQIDHESNIVGTTPIDKWNHAIKATIYGLWENFGPGYIAAQQKITVRYW